MDFLPLGISFARAISLFSGLWINNEICKSGKWFLNTPKGKVEKEPHYFGGMTVNPNKPGVIYVSREIEGIFEIHRMETKDFGQNWEVEPVTSNSKKNNVRPYVPRGASATEVVLWMENNRYTHYKDFNSAIRYQIRN